MIKISKQSQYGLRAMICLANSKEVCSVKTISLKEGIPFDFLEKIISKLEKAGILTGKKGAQGGYTLSCSPKKITAGDIVRALEGEKAPVDCSLCGKYKKCLSKNVWKRVEKAINDSLNSITLSDLIKP